MRTSGSKNAALPIMAASLLTDQPCRLANIPDLLDVRNATEILAALGVAVDSSTPGELGLTAAGAIGSEVPRERAELMRASILFLGPLLARTGRAVVPRPGGDDIGMRRVDQHIFGLTQLGARIEEREGNLVCVADRLRGAEIHLDMPTVTGTENILMAAVLAEGRTTIANAAREPHVHDLARALVEMGAGITGIGTDTMVVEGATRLHGVEHRVVADYLDAGTLAIAAAAVGGQVTIGSAPVADLRALILKLRQAGVDVHVTEDSITIDSDRDRLRAVDLITWTHPGFATDLQPQFTTLMTQARGSAVVQEFLFENRFLYLPELARLGAKVELFSHGRGVRVDGPSRLHGTRVAIPDIRAGAALLIAGLCAEGETLLENAGHLDRGYEHLASKLARLGAHLEEAA